MVVVLLLRRIAYNLLALLRDVTQRSEDTRGTPWKDLMRWMHNALIALTDADVLGLRARTVPATDI
jgi:asparagine N-glycosylation enzyme membrane subunit Stt3